jgi:glycine/D-amino acid oxidase-like deaminating enzyme/nitrite reductase/ring-hydroxylating ferredoxin subunit
MKSSYWIDTGPIRQFSPLEKDLNVSVLVVGAGITGITAAYLIKKAGFTVGLFERERAAMIDTGHTTAHLTHVTDLRLSELADNFGKDHAQATWDAGAAAIDQIEAIVREEKIECEFTRIPGYLHAPADGDWASESSKFKEEAKLANELLFDAEYLEAIPHFGVPGIRFANQAKFHPRKYLAGVLEKIPGDGSHVFEQSAAEEFDAEKRRAKVNGHWVQFDRLVVATHNPVLGMASVTEATLFQTKLSLYSSYVLGASVAAGSVPIASFWDTREPYDYLRVDRQGDRDYLIFGGEDHKTGQVSDTEARFERLKTRLMNIAPAARIDHRWSGQVIETMDGLPYIGQNADGQFIATGFSGNGMTFGTVSAIMARDWTTGAKNPWRDLFAVDRKKLKGAAWDYLRENKDYPFYLIKDRLGRAEADSVRELKPCTGMVIKSKAGKIAAYRDAAGNVTRRSAICTHMGCIVHWNEAEATWDCPCHGSRFKPDGEVIAGPAEAPLKAI